jgi:glucosamine--fructose-6-phosphate aminotransferase (isomerizing)
MGHTRWATHGRPTGNNAHPYATDRLADVHNGIIENFSEFRRELEAKGAKFATETDRGHRSSGLLIGARRGSPLAVGFGEGAMFIGSDATALAPFTDTVSYLKDGDWVVVTRERPRNLAKSVTVE